MRQQKRTLLVIAQTSSSAKNSNKQKLYFAYSHTLLLSNILCEAKVIGAIF
jgi:hypothetical protein